MKNRNFILETAQKSSIDEIRSKGVHTAKRGHEGRGSEGGRDMEERLISIDTIVYEVARRMNRIYLASRR